MIGSREKRLKHKKRGEEASSSGGAAPPSFAPSFYFNSFIKSVKSHLLSVLPSLGGGSDRPSDFQGRVVYSRLSWEELW